MARKIQSIQSVFFDLDGTLVDSIPGIEYAAGLALSKAGFQRGTRDLKALIGPPIRDILRHLATGITERDLDHLEQDFRAAYDGDGWRKTECYPGVKDMLSLLRKNGKACFLITNKPQWATQKIISMLEIADYFDDVLARDSRNPAFGSKAEMLDFLVVRHGLPISGCLMVGDTADDYNAGRALGMQVAMAKYGYGSLAEINDPVPVQFESPLELASLVVSME